MELFYGNGDGLLCRLLAGLLNQAEVVLAFGAVGQMFAGLSDNGAMDSTQLATTASVPDKALSKGASLERNQSSVSLFEKARSQGVGLKRMQSSRRV